MNTKEAIEKLEKDELLDEAIIKSYVILLKRGEKCCKIIERLRNVDANISIFSKSNETISMTALDVYLDEIDKEIK